MRAKVLLWVLLLVAVLFVVKAQASPNLVTNGNFENSTYTSNDQFGTGFGGQGVTGWTGNGGYNIYFLAGTDTTVGARDQYTSDPVQQKLYGPVGGNTSPGGGNFVMLDGTQGGIQGAISQVISGLAIGTNYQLSFDWGAGQLQSRTGATTDALQVSLGGQSFETAVVNNASQSFNGWTNQVFTFTATGLSETLTFLSIGTPSGGPPVATLDDVSLTAAPEPMSVAVLSVGLIGISLVRRRR